MFLPRHFTEDDRHRIVALTRSAGFGHLVVAGPDGLASTPLPFVVDDELASLRAHLARPSPVWRMAPCAALVIVPVSDTYISPSWYSSKAEHGKVVPTWNYEVVHLHGSLVAHDDPAWISEQVRDLTDLNEATMPAPWSVDDAPSDYVAQMARGIVGVELVVVRVDAKRKLSQNKVADDVTGVIAGLAGSDHHGAAAVRASMVDMGGADESR
jgi:transcriptional regulator